MTYSDNLSKFTHPLKYRYFLWKYIPTLWYWRVKILVVQTDKVIVELPFRRNNLNPFHSQYFAALMGAAELSTGILLFAFKDEWNIKLIVKSIKADFVKKANSSVVFEMNEGKRITEAIRQLSVGDSIELLISVNGVDTSQEVVCNIHVLWSIKKSN